MDKKFEDQIAKMAFGELSEAEAKEVRAHAESNADAAQALSSYEALRSDLRRMKDVPPDQLSKERLQNAILTQGLKPKPVRRSFPWVWVPTTAMVAALAFVVFAKLPSETKAPVVMDYPNKVADPIENVTDADSRLGLNLNIDDREMLKKSISSFEASVTRAPQAVQPETVSKPVQITTMVTKGFGRSGKRSVIPISDRHIRPVAHFENTTVVYGPPEQKTPETLVLISSDKDNNTGASNAVEVHQTEDVIVSS